MTTMTIEEMEREYSDLYKEVYGHRPSFEHLEVVDSMSNEEFIDEYMRLDDMLWAMRTQGEAP